tara:strand:- start:236 stop:754 length:519 start_codon:yes stop_codon:yes gene_type:complete
MDEKALGVKRSLKAYLFDDIWRYQKSLRQLEYWLNCSHSLIGKIITAYLRISLRKKGRKLGFSIPPNTVGPGLAIAHAGTIVINSKAKIGSNCRLHVCVNIGADIRDGNLAPKIGNNCYIAPGVKMYGNIEIGDNVAIGANSVVNKSFDSNITIAGIPAKIISNNGRLDYRA